MRLYAKQCGNIFHGGFTQQKLGLELIENQQLNSDWNQTHWDFIHRRISQWCQVMATMINVYWPKQDMFKCNPLFIVGSNSGNSVQLGPF